LRPRSDRSDPTRYAPLRDTENSQKSEPEAQEPQRPETVRSPGWTQYADMPSQQRSALEYDKAVQQHAQQRQPERPDAKPPEKSKDEQTREKENANRDLAQKLGSNQKAPDREREQER
jgi:hypothetical protein